MFLNFRTDIREAYNEVKQLYESFMAAANALKIKAKEGVLITGSSKQRPLSYYVEGGLDSLKIWNDFCQRLTKTHGSMEFPDHSTIAGFRQTTSTRQEIRQKFWNFLIYCSYVDGVNIQKGKWYSDSCCTGTISTGISAVWMRTLNAFINSINCTDKWCICEIFGEIHQSNDQRQIKQC